MKIKAIVLADLHTVDERTFIKSEHIENSDCIIIVGDTTATKKKFLPQVGKRFDFNFDLPAIGVLGNHENWNVVKSDRCKLLNIHKRVVFYKETRLAGIGGVIAQRPRRIYHNSLPDIIEWLKHLIEHSKPIDIFVMHEPPYKCFDYVRHGHRGVKEYRELLQKLKPKYLFVAHMHTYRGMINWRCGTTVINSGMALKGEYATIDTNKDKVVFHP